MANISTGSAYRSLLLGCIVLILASPARAADGPPVSNAAVPASKGQVLILVGLPGDDEHEQLFAETVKQWRDWLTGSVGFSSADVHVLFGNGPHEGLANGPATRESIENEATRLKQSLQTGDRLWVFFLGHANYDGEHAWFHLPGPDLRDDELGKLFAGLNCREQVFWLTTCESGRFLKHLAAKNRILIAATRSSGEDNETEFPEALSAVVARPLADLDVDKDGKLSVLELYYRIVADVQSRYAADNRLLTEHAQLDDNGDGVGTDRPLVADEAKQGETADGILSSNTFLPYPIAPPNVEKAEKAETLQPMTNPNPKP
jgi:hypothetical protein